MNDVQKLLQKIKADKEAAQNSKTGPAGQPSQGGTPANPQGSGGKAPRIQKSGGRGK